MPHIEGAILIHRPVAEVFDFVADETHEPLYNHEMTRAEQVGDGPIGKGTQFRAWVKLMGREAEMLVEFTEFERPHRLGSCSTLGSMETNGFLTFEPLGAATRMGWSWDVRVKGAMRAFGPLIAWMGHRQERRVWTGLKRLLEEEARQS